MIIATYDRKNLELKVQGHAKSAEKGEDLICAAASILVYTLAANVAEMSTDKKSFRRSKTDLKEGNAVISIAPVHGMKSVATVIFDSICSGFDILAQQYPENVRYDVV